MYTQDPCKRSYIHRSIEISIDQLDQHNHRLGVQNRSTLVNDFVIEDQIEMKLPNLARNPNPTKEDVDKILDSVRALR